MYRNFKKSKKAVRPLATAGLWVFTEAIAGIPGYILSFAWGRICNSQYAFLPMVQSASLLGGLFVSGVIVYFAASAAICIREKSVRVLVPALCVMLLNLAYGTASLCIKRDGELYTVSVVQSGLTASQKWRMGAQEVLEHHIKLCDGASGKLIVMPESALPITLNKSTYTERLTRVCKEKDAAMLVGGLYDEGEKSFSATYLITEDGGYDVYKKQQLVPFGEYIPFKEGLTWLFPTLFEKRNIDGGLSSGKRQEPLEYRNIKLGCVLCFDSVFSSYTRYATQHGAHILCVSTNDSWFSLSTAKRQHMAQSVIRAVENRRFVVRSASDGISAVIDDRGRIVAVAEHEDPTVFDAQIKLYRDKTLYTRFGDIPVLMLAALCVLAGIFLKEEKS